MEEKKFQKKKRGGVTQRKWNPKINTQIRIKHNPC